MQSTREEKLKSVNWRKEGDFSTFITDANSISTLDRHVEYIDDENSQKISICGYGDNKIVIAFSTPNTSLLKELASQKNYYAELNSFTMNDCRIHSSFIPALTKFINTINAYSHPLDENTNKEINEILKMVMENEIANPITALKLKMRSLLQNKQIYPDEATQTEIDKTYHKLCGYKDTEPMIKGIEGTEYILLLCADRIRNERNKADLLRQEIALLKAQLAAANRTSVAVHSQSLFGTNADVTQSTMPTISNL